MGEHKWKDNPNRKTGIRAGCWKTVLSGGCSGLLNGLFGSGGGMVAVPFLKKCGLEAKEAHATSISMILPMSLVSSWLYLSGGAFDLSDAWIFLPGGVAGAIAGALLLKKISTPLLNKIFGAFMIFAAVRLFFR